MEIYLEALIFKKKTTTVCSLQDSYMEIKVFWVFLPFSVCCINMQSMGNKENSEEQIYTIIGR